MAIRQMLSQCYWFWAKYQKDINLAESLTSTIMPPLMYFFIEGVARKMRKPAVRMRTKLI